MKIAANIYNIVLNLLLLFAGVFLIVFAKEIFINLGESSVGEDLSDEAAAMLLLLFIGSIVLIIIYGIAAFMCLVSTASITIIIIKYFVNKRITKGVYIYHLVIYGFYFYNVISLFSNSIFDVEVLLEAILLSFLVALPFIVGLLLNTFAILEINSEEKKGINDNTNNDVINMNPVVEASIEE